MNENMSELVCVPKTRPTPLFSLYLLLPRRCFNAVNAMQPAPCVSFRSSQERQRQEEERKRKEFEKAQRKFRDEIIKYDGKIRLYKKEVEKSEFMIHATGVEGSLELLVAAKKAHQTQMKEQKIYATKAKPLEVSSRFLSKQNKSLNSNSSCSL